MASRLQLYVQKLLLGLEYGIDLNNIAPNMDSMHFAMNVGLEF